MWWSKKDDRPDQRKHPRPIAQDMVKITRQDGVAIEKPSNIFDLSEGGLRLICRETLPIGTPLAIELNLIKGGAPLKLSGNLVWIHPMSDSPNAWFAGVQFADLNETDTLELRAIVTGYLNPQDG